MNPYPADPAAARLTFLAQKGKNLLTIQSCRETSFSIQ
jgi:hypothetical protein